LHLDLHYKKFGQPTAKPLLILHGLFGMLDNWQTLALQFAQQYCVYIIDQRNHGKSPHAASHTYPDMANDLLTFVDEHGIEKFYLIGHSMGGKTAMQFAVENEYRVDKLVIVDIAPKDYPMGEHDAIFDAFFDLPVHDIESRQDAENHLAQRITDVGVRQFLLKNLYRTNAGYYEWRCNVKAIHNHYAHILANSLAYYDTFSHPTLFVKGGKSDRYIDANEDMELIQHHFPLAQLQIINNAGHWVHAEQPKEFFDAVSHFLSQ
jgi:pimeloyl-ACP methyl ester carboxylesterase